MKQAMPGDDQPTAMTFMMPMGGGACWPCTSNGIDFLPIRQAHPGVVDQVPNVGRHVEKPRSLR